MPHKQKEIFEALSHSPEATAIYNNSDIRIAYVNMKMLEIWDKNENIVGSNFGDVFPEFREQGFDDILKNVWHSGKTFIAENTAADVKVNGVLTRFYFDFQYKALQKEGQTYAILHTAREVSERMAAWEALAEKERLQKQLNEELAASNEEIQAYSEEYQAINEKLSSTLEDLGASYEELRATHENLASMEDRAMYLLDNAPVAIGVYDVASKSIGSGNQLFKELWQIDDLQTNGSLSSFLSEDWLVFFAEIIDRVLISGVEESLVDKKIDVNIKGETISTFHNLTFQPIKNHSGHVVTVLIAASEVTDQKLEKEKVDLALEQAQLAKRASGFGVFDFDLTEQHLTCDERCREVLRLDIDKEISYDEDFLNRISPSDKNRVQMEIRKAFDKSNVNNHVSSTFLLRSHEDETPRWVNLIGQVHYDRKGIAKRFIGTITDVSSDMELKQDLLQRERSLQESNEELATTMEELAAANEELLTINEELQRAREISEQINLELRITNDKLAISEERLGVAIRSSQMGVWDVNFVEQTLTWDDRAKHIFGLSESTPVTYDERWNYIHPDDLDTLQEAVAASKVSSSTGTFSAHFRTRPGNQGKFNWVQLQGQVYFAADDTPVRFAGTIIDITERIVSQQQIDVINRSIAQKEIEQRMIVDAGKIGTYSYDLHNRTVSTNKHFSALFQFQDKKDFWTDKIFRIPITSKGVLTSRMLIDVIAKQTNFDEEFELQNPLTGQKVWLRSIGQQMFDTEQNKNMVYGIVLDITLQKLEEKRKMDFLGIVSHELKSPLTSLSGYIQILQSRSRKLQDESFANLLGSAARQNARMRGLIEGFLDVARIGEGKLGLKLVSFDTAVLLRNIQQTYQETIDSHSLQFSVLASFFLEADQDKIEQVIVNLVNNAIKYSPSGTTIIIEARNADDHFCIRVADQGPGISAENQQKLFSRFFRVENEQTEHVSGFGIGLYICREIISLHGGEIGIESELGNGSTFYFKLPITKKEQSVVA